MLTVVAMLLVLLAFVDIVSGIFISRSIERLRAELFAAIEEQRQAFRQLKQALAELQSAQERRETAQRKCDELQEKLLGVQRRIGALAELAKKRREVKVKVRGQRAD
jgi:peptidoglycan hydrolase CwlO-like protein